MRVRWMVGFVAALLSVLALGALQPAEVRAQASEEQRFLELVNDYRQANGLGSLSFSTPLSAAARNHSADMGAHGFFSHATQGSSYYPAGSGHQERTSQEGYPLEALTAENIAWGQDTADEVFDSWRNSSGHNANMLGDYEAVGVGLAYGDGTPYWTAVFGSEGSSGAAARAPAAEEEPAVTEPTVTPAERSPSPANATERNATRNSGDPATEASTEELGFWERIFESLDVSPRIREFILGSIAD